MRNDVKCALVTNKQKQAQTHNFVYTRLQKKNPSIPTGTSNFGSTVEPLNRNVYMSIVVANFEVRNSKFKV